MIRRTTALPQKRAEIEALLTRDGVERFLNELGRGAIEAVVVSEAKDDDSNESSPPSDKLALGDTVTVRLPALEFTGLTGLAQMLMASRAPEKIKPLIEKNQMFGKLGAGLDMAYGLLRGGLTFSSKITEMSSGADEFSYVDEGVELPKVLKSWRHTHKISDSGDAGMIVDELEVEVDPAIAAPVIEGALRLHLESRAKAYRKALESL